MATMLIPLGRPGTPEEAAGGVFFLCSPWSNYVHGQALNVTGGQFTGMASDAAPRAGSVIGLSCLAHTSRPSSLPARGSQIRKRQSALLGERLAAASAIDVGGQRPNQLSRAPSMVRTEPE